MDRTWYTLVLIGFIEVVIFTSYRLYMSFTGQNVDLVKKIDETPIEPDLKIEKLVILDSTKENILITDEDLE